MTLNDKLEAFLRARPNEWIDGRVIAEVAGYAGYRNRITDLRLLRGLRIDNDKRPFRREDGKTVTKSYYRYVPQGQMEMTF
jgi:hypothetical protein